ncbi:hypothetical protein [Roseivirga misakiensis]|uniref:Uncharacterized protein n=1 Tax=Roseivirga misakiensis TaxID=1563681 RepID=A0A1E5T3E1_9BACT|nr:hypothetical protein [Roseivirga misakiensis]OEK05905.1 hypothetical protein BFP71_07260 [Roseivirga misakiensis]
MGHKITGWVALLGLILVITSFILKTLSVIDLGIRSIIMICGFTLMLLGTLWRVVLEMNDDGQSGNP